MFKLNTTSIAVVALLALSLSILFYSNSKQQNTLPVVAIANYGPHSSLQDSIQGFKDELARNGYNEGEQIQFDIADVNFEPSLISQMLAKLKAHRPKAMIVMTTPVAQAAKNSIKDIPLVFSVITDPVEAGLITQNNIAASNMTGASDRQDISVLLKFAKELLPHAKTVGVLYATGEANDAALLKMLEKEAYALGMQVLAVPVEQARDVHFRMQNFKNKADFIYVGVSGPIQPTLPVISIEAGKMNIPVFNADSDAVKNNQVLGSFGVDYYQVGVNTAHIVERILKGESVDTIEPIYPSNADHHGFISQVKADSLGIVVPSALQSMMIAE